MLITTIVILQINYMYVCVVFRKSHERDCIAWFMGASDVYKFLKYHGPKASGIWKLQTSRATINQEMHEQVRALFCLLSSQQSCFGIKYLENFIEPFVLVLFNFMVDFPFYRPILPNFQILFKVFWFLEFSFRCSTSLWFVCHFVFVLKFGACRLFPLQLPYSMYGMIHCTQWLKIHSAVAIM